MTDIKQPELPKPYIEIEVAEGAYEALFSDDQMHAHYAKGYADGKQSLAQPEPLQQLTEQAQALDMGYGASACPTCGKSQPAQEPSIEKMVNRFLGWKLPKNFSPDAGITFTRPSEQYEKSGLWPIGTNLLDADQAKEMFEYVLASSAQQPAQAAVPGWQPIETAPLEKYVIVWRPAFGWSVAICSDDHGRRHWFARQEQEACYPTHWMPLPAAPEREGNKS